MKIYLQKQKFEPPWPGRFHLLTPTLGTVRLKRPRSHPSHMKTRQMRAVVASKFMTLDLKVLILIESLTSLLQIFQDGPIL